MQFLFRPQSLVLFCRINTLDGGKKQEGRGLMVNARQIFGVGRGMWFLTFPKYQLTYLAQRYFQIFIQNPYAVNAPFKNNDKTPMCLLPSFPLKPPAPLPLRPSPVLTRGNQSLFLLMLTHMHTSLRKVLFTFPSFLFCFVWFGFTYLKCVHTL